MSDERDHYSGLIESQKLELDHYKSLMAEKADD